MIWYYWGSWVVCSNFEETNFEIKIINCRLLKNSLNFEIMEEFCDLELNIFVNYSMNFVRIFSTCS